MASFLALSLAVPQLQLVVLSSPLIFMMCYLWSRSFPTSEVSIWGLFRVKVRPRDRPGMGRLAARLEAQWLRAAAE